MADFVGCEQGHFLLNLNWKDGWETEWYAQPQTSQPHMYFSHRFFIYNFTEITITTPSLTRILDRLIGGGISLCGDDV
jgi:hypothetical protein